MVIKLDLFPDQPVCDEKVVKVRVRFYVVAIGNQHFILSVGSIVLIDVKALILAVNADVELLRYLLIAQINIDALDACTVGNRIRIPQIHVAIKNILLLGHSRFCRIISVIFPLYVGGIGVAFFDLIVKIQIPAGIPFITVTVYHTDVVIIVKHVRNTVYTRFFGVGI